MGPVTWGSLQIHVKFLDFDSHIMAGILGQGSDQTVFVDLRHFIFRIFCGFSRIDQFYKGTRKHAGAFLYKKIFDPAPILINPCSCLLLSKV